MDLWNKYSGSQPHKLVKKKIPGEKKLVIVKAKKLKKIVNLQNMKPTEDLLNSMKKSLGK